MNNKQISLLSLPVIVGSLGFFVDIYDLLLFNITRLSSLKELGITGTGADHNGENILNWQMAGLVIGGIGWGMMGDIKGRKSVLFGSILLYSLATIVNGFVQNLTMYTLLRFVAGLGLAGELGASITLTTEILPREKRGLAAAIIATSGVMGTITAYFVHNLSGENWRLCYYIGGAMGIALLFMRVRIHDSRLFNQVKTAHIRSGDFRMFFTSRDRFFRYGRSILIGLPVWYVIGILISFSNVFAEKFGIRGFDQPKALMLQYLALAFGDMFAGILSNWIRSRKKTLFIYYGILAIFVCMFFLLKGGGSAFNMYLLCMGLGFGSGISVLYITMSAEQFGTNLRATAAISVPNMVRGFLLPISFLFKFLRSESGMNNYLQAAFITGGIVILIGLLAVFFTKETFAKEMDYLET